MVKPRRQGDGPIRSTDSGILFRPFLGIVLATLAVPAGAREAGPERPPNLVLLMIDDMGAEALPSYGGTQAVTPHLDELAAGGIRFTNAFAQPLCTPTRVQIMTGKYNFRNYVQFGYLSPDETTFADLLHESGYATGVFGKWQLSGPGAGYPARNDPDAWGFDAHTLWQLNFRPGHGDKGSRFWGPKLERDGELVETGPDDYAPDIFTDDLLRFVEAHRDEPFLAYFPMALTHSPYVPTPASDFDPSEGKPSNEGPVRADRFFVDMVEHVDRIVGRIVDRLEELGLEEETVVIVTGDNGTGRSITMETVAGPVEGRKGYPVDAGMRVPLIVSWPGTLPAGRVDERLVDMTDVLPTLLACAGVDPPRDLVLDGRRFVDPPGHPPVAPRAWIYCYYDPRHGNSPLNRQRAIFARDERYKLDWTGTLSDVSVSPERVIPRDEADIAAHAARRRLQAVLDHFGQSFD